MYLKVFLLLLESIRLCIIYVGTTAGGSQPKVTLHYTRFLAILSITLTFVCQLLLGIL